MAKRSGGSSKPVIGWREWVSLPLLKTRSIKAKIDTGARSSSLHAFDLTTFQRGGVTYVQFRVHPFQRDSKVVVTAEAKVLEFRHVKSSSGHATLRPVIVTDVELLAQRWQIELTLANRDEMGFRMLLGREAVRGRFLVDPGGSYHAGRPKPRSRKAASQRARQKQR